MCPGLTVIAIRKTEADHAHGFLITAPIRAGNTAHGQGKFSAGRAAGTAGHGRDHRFGHRTMAFQQCRRNAQHVLFGTVRVAHPAPFEPGRTARHISETLGQPTAGTGLSQDKPPTTGKQTLTQVVRQGPQLLIIRSFVLTHGVG